MQGVISKSSKNERTSQLLYHLKVRSVKEQTHEHTADCTGNGDGHDPGENKQADSLPVDSLDGTVAETDTNGGASNAHGGGDGERVLGEDEHGDGGTHLHGRTTGRRVVGDLVTHDCFASVSEFCKEIVRNLKSLPFMML